MTKLTEYTKNGFWEIIAAPVIKKTRIGLVDLKPLLLQSQVRHRGWPFPFMRSEDEKMYSSSFQSVTIGERVPKFEGFRLYENGFFYWKGVMWENFETGYGDKVLSFGNVNWEITEMLLFLKRLYENILSPNEVIHVRIRLGGCKGRTLFDRDGWHLDLERGNPCAENTILIEDDFNCSQLKASWQELAKKYIKKVYAIFGTSHISDEYITKSQNELLKMKMI